MKQIFILFLCFFPLFTYAQNNAEEQAIMNDPYFSVYKETMQPIEEKANALSAEFRAAGKEKQSDEHYIRSMNSKYQTIVTEYNRALKKFIADHPNSVVSLVAFDQLLQGNFDLREIEPVYKQISASVKNSGIGKQIEQRFLALQKMAIGSQAPEFTQNNPDGKPVKLSDFRGKYLLLDFWASWCGPCRKENPHVVKAYDKFKTKNFEILGISLDNPNAKNAWLKAIEADKLTWPQVSDLKGWQNDVAVMYGVQSIPQNFLLDPNGIIIAKNLRGEDLTAKLTEILK